MSLHRLQYLFNKYVSQQCTPEEKDEFLQLVRESKYDEDVRKLMEEVWHHSKDHEKLNREEADLIFSRILGTNSDQIKEKPRKRLIMARYMAAASIILIIGFSIFKFRADKKDPVNIIHNNSAVVNKNDVLPGTEKATLTLADGSTIFLDQAANGNILQQGKAQVSKTNNELVYTATNDDADQSVTYNMIQTPRGGQYRLTLADGTKVWLNAASSLRFPTSFPGNKRMVEITGEAYFEVHRDHTKRFIVTVNGECEVEVLGTHFNVLAYKDENTIKTSLIEGSVKLRKENSIQILKPGQQGQFTGKGIMVLNNVDMDHVVAWKNGLFDFEDEHIIDIMRQLSRWYDVDIFYSGDLPEQHYSGSIRRSVNLSQVLKMFEQIGDVNFKIEGKKIIVKEN